MRFALFSVRVRLGVFAHTLGQIKKEHPSKTDFDLISTGCNPGIFEQLIMQPDDRKLHTCTQTHTSVN